MSDQERPAPGYESSLPQKPANLDSKVPIQMTHKCNAKPTDATNGGYYLNVAQKGKLILPTALWILLIIAGVSFITLLATLNKSINTLDALVELEQEKKELSIVEHLSNRKLGREFEPHLKKSNAKPGKSARKHHKQHEVEQPASEPDVIQIVGLSRPQAEGGWLLPIEPSWFAMPSWTSLEPVRQQRPPARPSPPLGLLDEMMRGTPGAPETIIIQDGQMAEAPLSLMNSFMKQLAPLLDRLMPGGSGEVSGVLSITEQPHLPATISAKIDNLNEHIKQAQRKPLMSRQDGESSLEQSIDELVGNLMAPPRLVPPKSLPHHRPHLRPPHEAALRPMLSPPAEVPPFHRPDDGPDAVFFQISTSDEPKPLEQNRHKKLGLPAEDGELIISISGGPEPVRPSGETNRHQVSNTRRPSAGHSPYEQESLFPGDLILFNPFEMMKPEHRPAHQRHRPDHHVVLPGKPAETPWDFLANELAEGLVEDAFKQQQQQQQQKRPNHVGSPDEPQIIIVDDTAPLAPGEQPNVIPTIFRPENFMPMFEPPALDGAHTSSKRPPQVGDMFNMLFAPAPESKQSEQANQSTGSTPKVEPTAVTNSNESTSAQAATTGAPSSASSQAAPNEMTLSMSSMEPTMSSEVKKEVDSTMSQLPKQISSSPDEIDHQAADQLLQDFMRPLFSLPQMSGDQHSASTTGSRPSAGSADFATVSTNTSTTPPTTTTNSPASATHIPKSTNASAPSGESRVNSIFSKVIGIFTDQQPASQAEESKTTTVSTSTMPPPGESTTRLMEKVASAPIVELIEEQDALDQLPAIDLSPFAKSSKPSDRVPDKLSSGSPAGFEAQTSTGAAALSSSSTSKATTSKPNLVTVSEADLDAEAHRSKSFLQKANDVLERQILGLKRFLNVDKP